MSQKKERKYKLLVRKMKEETHLINTKRIRKYFEQFYGKNSQFR